MKFISIESTLLSQNSHPQAVPVMSSATQMNRKIIAEHCELLRCIQPCCISFSNISKWLIKRYQLISPNASEPFRMNHVVHVCTRLLDGHTSTVCCAALCDENEQKTKFLFEKILYAEFKRASSALEGCSPRSDRKIRFSLETVFFSSSSFFNHNLLLLTLLAGRCYDICSIWLWNASQY